MEAMNDSARQPVVLEHLEVMTSLAHNYEHARDRARQLLRSILPKAAWSELEQKGVIRWIGKRGTYVISPYAQTEILDASGRSLAYACLQLSVPAPAYDRMIAEYLLIRNSENLYWRTANIFSRRGSEFGITALFMIALDTALLINLVLELLALR